MEKILLVEDDHGIIDPLSLYLKQANCEVQVAENGSDALVIFGAYHPDLIILDLNLPVLDGFSVCERIRETSNTPIIILSARDGEEDKIRALEIGADDYMSKPFSPRELVARIQAVLKRFKPRDKAKNHDELLEVGHIVLDRENYRLEIDGKEIKTTKTEFLLLTYLMTHRDEVIRRDVLMRDIMGYDHYLYDRTIDTHMKNLRRKIGDAATIETVRGIGYRVEVGE